MKKLQISVETIMCIEIPDSMSEKEILEFANDYRAKVVTEARSQNAEAHVVYELIA